MDIFRIRMSAPSSPSLGPATLPVEGDVLLDRYRVIRQLGAGGMGVVYEAVNLRTGRRVAIKCLNPESALDPVALRRFEGEARGATSIGNPHIIDVIDMDALPNGVHFIVLEYLDGTELGRELKTHGPFQVRRAVSIVLQMCEALALAHEKGIIHRDLKPANVFLIERDGNPDYVKILDFGISKFREPGSDAQSLTETGKILGTPLYMAPEQMMNAKGASPRADLYALGCILFAALTGRPPFVAENLVELIVKVQQEPLPDVRSLRPDVPRELAAVVHKLLARDPDERFTDCAALHAALQPFVGQPVWTVTPATEQGRTTPDAPSANVFSSGESASSVSKASVLPPRSTRLRVGVAALALAVVVFGAVAATRFQSASLRLASRASPTPPVVAPPAPPVGTSAFITATPSNLTNALAEDRPSPQEAAPVAQPLPQTERRSRTHRTPMVPSVTQTQPAPSGEVPPSAPVVVPTPAPVAPAVPQVVPLSTPRPDLLNPPSPRM
jgi:serine/threonine-protein kinase